MLTSKVYIFCFTCWILIFVLFTTAGPMPPQSPPSLFWGCWVVTRRLPTNGVSGLSKEQAHSMIGKRIMFTPTCATSGRRVISSPKYSVKVLSAREFFELGHFPLSQIGIREQEVTEVELTLPDNLSDLDFAGSDVFLREKDMVIIVENDSFLVERAKPKDAACACGQPSAK